MLRSLRARILVSLLGVVAIAVVVTAGAVVTTASDAFRSAQADVVSRQLAVIEALESFGRTDGDLAGLPALSARLASEQNVRVVVRDPDAAPGDPVLADSLASNAGPAAFLDARPIAIFSATEESTDIDIDAPPPPLRWSSRGIGGPVVALYTGTPTPNFMRAFLPRLAAGVGAVAVIALALSVLVARRVGRPVLALQEVAIAWARGDLAVEAPRSRIREFDELALGLDDMAARLEASEARRRDLTNDVAHELRTPLANLRGYLEAAQDGVVTLDAELVGSLHEEATHLTTIVEDLRQVAQAEAGEMHLELVETSAADLVESVATSFGARARAAGVTVVWQASDLIVLTLDPVRMRQVLINLVENAMRHTKPGGKITLEVRADRWRDGGGFVEFAVADTGSGIDPDMQEKIFDRFTRAETHRSRMTGGTGLGLAVVRAVAEAHGGEVGVFSQKNLGSRFMVRIPR